MPHHTRDTLHTKLAEVYTLNQQFDEALESFHFAIRLVGTASVQASLRQAVVRCPIVFTSAVADSRALHPAKKQSSGKSPKRRDIIVDTRAMSSLLQS